MTDLDHLLTPPEQRQIVRREVFLDMVRTNAHCDCQGHRYALDAAITAAVKFGASLSDIREAYLAGREGVG